MSNINFLKKSNVRQVLERFDLISAADHAPEEEEEEKKIEEEVAAGEKEDYFVNFATI